MRFELKPLAEIDIIRNCIEDCKGTCKERQCSFALLIDRISMCTETCNCYVFDAEIIDYEDNMIYDEICILRDLWRKVKW